MSIIWVTYTRNMRETNRVVGDQSVGRKVVEDRMATGADNQLAGKSGTTETAGGTDLRERDDHVQLANDFSKFVEWSNVAAYLG